jgi:uncharacterized protein YjdB
MVALVVCALVAISAACEDDDDPMGPGDNVATVEFTSGPQEIEIGSTGQLTFEIRDAGGALIDPDDVTVTFSSSSAAVATVSTTGLVTPVAPGTATITIQVGTLTDTVTVTVVPEISSIGIVNTELVLFTDETLGFAVTVLDAEGDPVTNPVLTFTSSDEAVASVDEEGNVTGETAGTATITVAGGGESDTIEITVIAAASGGLVLVGRSFTVQADDELVINNLAIVRDAGGVIIPDAEVAFTTTDAAVVTVDAAGLLVAHAPGEAFITVTSPDAAGSATMQLKVVPAGTVDLLEIDPVAATIAVGATVELLVNAEADGVPILDFLALFSSSDEAVAVVEPSVDLSDFPIGVVTGVAPGVATITASTGDLAAEAVITVE